MLTSYSGDRPDSNKSNDAFSQFEQSNAFGSIFSVSDAVRESTLESPVNGDQADGVTISITPAVDVTPGSPALDLPDTPDDSDAKSALKKLRLNNIGRLTIGYLNINSIRNKFDALKEIVSQNLDILMVAETKIDDPFPREKFHFEGYADPLRLDRNCEGGGLLVYVKSDITTRQLKSFKFEIDVECICFEVNLRGKKWALFSIYRPPSQSQDYFFENLGKASDHYSEKCDNFLLLGDFDTLETDQQIRTFMNS